MIDLEELLTEAVAREEWNRRNPDCDWDTDVMQDDAKKARKKARRAVRVALPLIRTRLSDELAALAKVPGRRQDGLGIERQDALRDAGAVVRGNYWEPDPDLT